MEWDVVLFSGIFRCHLYGNAVRFFAGYRSLHCMDGQDGHAEGDRHADEQHAKLRAADRAEFHDLQQIVLCENQKVSIEKKLASTILLVLMICATAAFVWFTFLV